MVSGWFDMMTTNRKLYARASALPAIAAALALSSTPLFAQEAQPVTATPPATIEPAPTTDATPVTTETTTTADPATTEPAPQTTSTTKTVKRTTRTAARPMTTRATTRTVGRAAAPVVPAAPAATPAPSAASGSAVAPVVDLNSKPTTPPTGATAEPAKADDTLPIAAGGALALLALGGAGIAWTKRRRRHEEQEWIEDEQLEHEPTELVAHDPEPMIHEQQPAIVGPSAFAWGNASSEPARTAEPVVEEDDRIPGESWVQRAYRGSTPNNPSVSLRARLKRAAFFDKRERDVAAGKAEPVELDAGLPEAMVEEQEREFA